MIHLDAALRALARAVDVEQAAIGTASRATQMRVAAGTNRLIVDALHAGATTADIAVVLDRAVTTARDRIRRARKAAGEWEPRPPGARTAPQRHRQLVAPLPTRPVEPQELAFGPPPEAALKAPNVWLEVPRCGASLPPPWPVSARCTLSLGHRAGHAERG